MRRTSFQSMLTSPKYTFKAAVGAFFVYFCVIAQFRGSSRVKTEEIRTAEKLYGNVKCIPRTSMMDEKSEGYHYPNQTLYEKILTKEPEDLTKNIDREERRQIRGSWGAKNISRIENKKAAVVFLVASDLEDVGCLVEEYHKHEDLLMVKMNDSYRGLVYKLLMAYRFISKRFPTVHLVKVDRDVVLDVDQLMKLFDENKAPLFIFGRLWNDVHPSRIETERWFVPLSVFPEEAYPWYVDGSFYILSYGSLAEIVKAAPGEKVFELEDAFFTGILRRKVHLMISPLPYFQFYPFQYMGSCSFPYHHRLVGEKIRHDQTIEGRFQMMIEFKRKACNIQVFFPNNISDVAKHSK